MGTGNPYTTIIEPTFVARFLLDSDTDTVDTVANVDAFVELPDGSAWALTIFTAGEVGRLLARWKETGEVANGSYFWAVDQASRQPHRADGAQRLVRGAVLHAVQNVRGGRPSARRRTAPLTRGTCRHRR
jgi:hypothetical protein